ncbi:hypothetical protein L202_00946 [Cryptococcus amylolentus CBS 6039]|uniref:Uncharacterized protein n=1 Tax=Cryptococcus amylolentus CBS 6039 TaxID=1295533 RepID=A0A1E3I279_9TREE|nr:hypothetical protein L202_00946 [Cryptococcus amylolentus CBS 6039]ODN82649.1 hypothetical protein L202_00946 [Cryptococcus amylolentus CBS 6039]
MSSRTRTRPPAARTPTKRSRPSPGSTAPTDPPAARPVDRKCSQVPRVAVTGYMRKSSKTVEQRILKSQTESVESVQEDVASIGSARYDRPLVGGGGWADRLQPVAGPSRPTRRVSPMPSVSIGTFESQQTAISLASLPDPEQLTIRIALPQGTSLDETEAGDWYVAGEEVLVEAMRKEKEGVMERRGWNGKGKGKGKPLEENVMWLSAPLVHPCICSVEAYAKRYTLAHSPPQHRTLPPLPPHPKPSHIPKVGANLSGWTQGLDKDLDMTLDEMEEFEECWTAMPAQIAPLPVVEKDVQDDWERLLPARDLSAPSRMASPPPRAGATATAQVDGKSQGSEASVSMELGREDVAKRRSAWWREQYASDPVYGRVDKIIKPHSRGPLIHQKYPQTALVPLYTPPSQLSTWPYHPYHPNLDHYIQKRPWARVCWVIPVHGPVHIPGINDPLEPFVPPVSAAGGSPKNAPTIPRQLIPSSGVLALDSASLVAKKGQSASTIYWTPQRLKYLIQQWLIPSWQDDTKGCFGPLSWAVQSGNLDWWSRRDVREGRRREGEGLHVEVPDATAGKKSVKAEMGDCLKIWCDARRALSLRMAICRTWVPAEDYSLLDPTWPVPEPPPDPATLSEDGDDYELGTWEEKGGPMEVRERLKRRVKKEEARREAKKGRDARKEVRKRKREEIEAEIEKTRVMFMEKARLTLLDDKGQVLVVA